MRARTILRSLFRSALLALSLTLLAPGPAHLPAQARTGEHDTQVYDEAWRLMAQPALLARMQAQWKLSRALGIANLMVIHRISDLDAVGDADSQNRNLALGLLADCSTKIVYAQERGEAALRTRRRPGAIDSKEIRQRGREPTKRAMGDL